MKNFRINEHTLTSGEIRFVPERYGKFLGNNQWITIGEKSHYLTFEQAKQEIDKYKMEHPEETSNVKHHYVD
jgi:hypothetical protein